MTHTPIRVLVVDDSATVRRLLVDILESDAAIRVIGEAANGVEAVEKAVSLAPDLITMDVVMPVMDGLEATKEIMIAAPTPILIVSASGNRSVMDLSFDATQAGALMVVSKPQSPQSHRFHEKREQLLQMVKAMAQVKVVRRWGSRSRLTAGHVQGPGSSGAMAHDPAESSSLGQVVAIGTSTGGPAALRRILIDLPGDFAAPILVVQHMAKGFVGGLAAWLNTSCRLHVKVATDGEVLEPRVVYLAPDNRHLGVRRDGRTSLSHAQPVGGFRPAASFLFQSVARVYGSNAVGIILTGMGSDGVTGLKELRAAGGYVLAQDESSSVVYGMAQEAVQAGAVDAILPLEEIAPRLIELVA